MVILNCDEQFSWHEMLILTKMTGSRSVHIRWFFFNWSNDLSSCVWASIFYVYKLNNKKVHSCHKKTEKKTFLEHWSRYGILFVFLFLIQEQIFFFKKQLICFKKRQFLNDFTYKMHIKPYREGALYFLLTSICWIKTFWE